MKDTATLSLDVELLAQALLDQLSRVELTRRNYERTE